jgi:hypothetical protein
VKSEAWHVFQDDDAGSNLANPGSDLGPDPAVVFGVELLAGGAVWLAGESGGECDRACSSQSL